MIDKDGAWVPAALNKNGTLRDPAKEAVRNYGLIIDGGKKYAHLFDPWIDAFLSSTTANIAGVNDTKFIFAASYARKLRYQAHGNWSADIRKIAKRMLKQTGLEALLATNELSIRIVTFDSYFI